MVARPGVRAKFFDIDPDTGGTGASSTSTSSPGVRVEDEEVFETTHAQGARARGRGRSSTGCAIDHPDGLADPARLPASACATRGVEHVWVEKILQPGEALRDWPVEGTMGYEFLNDATALFVDPAAEAPLTEL